MYSGGVAKPERSEAYKAWIRTLPCLLCGTTRGIEPCHTGPHGMGQKASDFTCVPACAWHHRHGKDAIDVLGKRFGEHHGIDMDELRERLNAAWRSVK